MKQAFVGMRKQGGLKILLAEDDKLIRSLVRRLIELQGFEVLEAEDGVIAANCFEEHPGVCLLVTDVVMPFMDGMELYATLRNKNPQLKVIFMSGYTGEVLENRGLRTSDFAFLQKPFSNGELIGKVKEVLEN